jgi:hypothetical protein
MVMLGGIIPHAIIPLGVGEISGPEECLSMICFGRIILVRRPKLGG